MKILAIDQASRLGWAISAEVYGTWDLTTRKDESIGMKLVRLRAKLDEICRLEGITLIVYERVAGMHTSAVIHSAKLVATIEMYCTDNNIDYASYSASEIKKFATGKGNAKKDAMIQAAKEKYGYTGNDDNEADALHILHLAKQNLNG